MGLRDLEAKLPPGFRFYPRDEELVSHYLHKRIANEMQSLETMVEIDLHSCEPWQLPGESSIASSIYRKIFTYENGIALTESNGT